MPAACPGEMIEPEFRECVLVRPEKLAKQGWETMKIAGIS